MCYMYVQFNSCVHYKDGQNILKHTRKTGCLFCFFIYVNKIGTAASSAIKKVNINKIFSKRNKYFYEFLPTETAIKKYTCKNRTSVFWNKSLPLLNTVVLLPNSFNLCNFEGCM